MYKDIAYGAVAVAAALALSGLGAGTGALATAGRAGHPAGHAAASGTAGTVPGAQLWVQRYNGPANGDDRATAVAVSPAGGRVFVTGSRDAPNGRPNYATVAYNAATGAQQWVNMYNGPANRSDLPESMAVSPRGDRVFVTGYSDGGAYVGDYATVAFNAATGAQLWAKRYSNGNYYAAATSVAVSPSGGIVYVTGSSDKFVPSDGGSAADYVTIAYNAATGAQRWLKHFTGVGSYDNNYAHSVAVSPRGGTVFVTGEGFGGDYATVAYNAATGAQLWVGRYNGPANGEDTASSMAVSPRGDTVFVTGTSDDRFGGDYATVAYSAATGAQLWVKRYNPSRYDTATAVAVSSTGSTVYVTGYSYTGALADDYATVAYNAATGARLWVGRYNGPANGHDQASSVTVSPTGGTVYVTGTSPGAASREDYATIAYNAATGAQLWVGRYNGPANGDDSATSVAVSPDGAKVFVTGGSSGGASGGDYATIAYSG